MNKIFGRRLVLGVAALVLIIGGLVGFANLWHERYAAEDLKLAEDALRNYATMCYALEGEYPETLDYLTSNYPLTLNEEEFVYHYKYIGANMMPEITVIPLN